ncbi:hypothetical protein RA27_18270 [Ruegeria sp. ANG-R]|uniref:hypothetical protein n=1 Tax=Ruegeria sp. ANG-R TaxID=1577903 RepID=UPI00057DF6AA|nr:hypothetical protein [Ruegeria sp. ANG-R]KIC38838.1 hypothetical protein RA27_18270 [Ruegeria sp. ANG-R]
MSDTSMTAAEQTLADDKMRAEIAKLIAESAKINAEARWYPIAVGTGFAGVLLTAGVAMAKLFFGA